MEQPRKHSASRPIEYLLSGISSTSSILTRFIRSVRASHSDLSAVTRELSDLRLLLELLRDEPSIPLPLQAQMLLLLEGCGNTLIRIDSILAQCRNASEWSHTGQTQIGQCRDNLGLFREVLGLALDILSLDPTQQSNAAETDSIIENVKGEVERLRAKTRSNEKHDPDTSGVLDLYLDAVTNCIRSYEKKTQAARDRSGSEETVTTSGPVKQDNLGIEEDLEAIRLSQKTPVPATKPKSNDEPAATSSAPHARQPMPHENADKWTSSRTNAFSYYSGQQDSITVKRPEDHEPLPDVPPVPADPPVEAAPTAPPRPLPESPTLPGRSGTPTPVPPREITLPPPLTRSAWSHEDSPSTKSEPFGSASYLEAESPTFTSERWSEPVHMQASQGYPETERSRQTSTAPSQSPQPGRESPRTSFASHRINSGISEVSALRSDSGSPQQPSPGASMVSAMSPYHQSPPFSPPPDYRRTPTPKSQWTPGLISPSLISPSVLSSSLHAPSIIAPSIASASQLAIPTPAKHSGHQSRIEVVPERHLTDKGKSSQILHIDTSPANMFVATKHDPKIVKIWSISKNAVHSTIKITSYVQPQVRSREYFIRSHAILSENATLIGITTHFGLTLEIWNFCKGGTSAKKVQVIDEAHRWAASKRDAYHTDYAPLVVYRPKGDRIDRFFLARHPSAKKPFWEDSTHSIELLKAELPFVPKFPELTFSSDSPFLVAAAGPRPGDAPRAHATILIAWLMKPTSDHKLRARTPNATVTSLEDEDRHKPYRVNIPEYPALQTALPASLIAHGSLAVSIWIPANHTDVAVPGGKYRRHPVPAPERFVVVWDLPANATRIFAIPNVQACISPNCKYVAYCDANAGQFVIIEVDTAEEIWKWPDSGKGKDFAGFGAQFEDLHKVTVFEFSPDGKMLVVGDDKGSLGVYEVKKGEERFELGSGMEVSLADVGHGHYDVGGQGQGNQSRFSDSSLYVPLGWQGQGQQGGGNGSGSSGILGWRGRNGGGELQS
ncbi:hypothetical protein QBC40DRAFT_268286 [Triangularia verruculosa]|uniref:Uncharacterized protein n=1 Tax=Triangularia verruculosa TaxID=2587418 RepID=A0AAN7ARQ7_9PEZI|nr:hypothetical protein QBC40DRAFT_268286 [Triangularia verruculosa]